MEGVLCLLVRFWRRLQWRLGLLDWKGDDGRMERDMIVTTGFAVLFYFHTSFWGWAWHGDSALSISLLKDYFMIFFHFRSPS